MTFFNYQKMQSLGNVTLRGLARWIFATFVLIILGSIVFDETDTLCIDAFTFFLIANLFMLYRIYNESVNRPVLPVGLPLSRKKESRYRILMLLYSNLIFLLFFLGLEVGCLLIWKHRAGKTLSKVFASEDAGFLANAGYLYLLLMLLTLLFALLPLTQIRKRKVWYACFLTITTIFFTANAILANSAGLFRAESVNLIENFDRLSHPYLTLCVAGAVCILVAALSIFLMFRLNRPKQFSLPDFQ